MKNELPNTLLHACPFSSQTSVLDDIHVEEACRHMIMSAAEHLPRDTSPQEGKVSVVSVPRK